MASLPNYRPHQMSLGPLEQEVLHIVWNLGGATVKDVHQQIISDPNRELAYTSVTTVLKRLTQKGWLTCNDRDKIHHWQACITREEANALNSYDQLNQFLNISNPDLVVAFADNLDQTSLDKLDAIAQRLKDLRAARGE